MKTQRVSAVDMLDAKTPFTFKGRRGLYNVTKTQATNGRVYFYTLRSDGLAVLIASMAPNDDVEIVINQNSADHLLETIGALHTRNKSLQKGHATLTRRVQELETELENVRSQLISQPQLTVRGMPFTDTPKTDGNHIQCGYLENSLSGRAIDAIIADVMKREPTAADVKLQADMRAVSESAKAVAEAVHTTVERMLQPGDLLYRGLK